MSKLILIEAAQGLDHPVKLAQNTKTLYTVTYGLEVKDRLSLLQALDEFSYCVRHSAECMGVKYE